MSIRSIFFFAFFKFQFIKLSINVFVGTGVLDGPYIYRFAVGLSGRPVPTFFFITAPIT